LLRKGLLRYRQEGAPTGGPRTIEIEFEGEEHARVFDESFDAIDWKVTKTGLGLQAT
jgi:hypothetical protein